MSRGVGYVVDTGDDGGAITQNILVVEDKPETCEFLKAMLERNGYMVRVATDGGQAHSTFAMYKPDIVLLDLILPGESGFEICERLKAHRDTVPVLVLSAIDLESSRNLAAKAGADAIVIDGMQAGTGASSQILLDHSGIPTITVAAVIFS